MFICTGPKPQRFIETDFVVLVEWRIFFHTNWTFFWMKDLQHEHFWAFQKDHVPQASLKTDRGLKTPKVPKISGFSRLTLLPVPQITNSLHLSG